MTGPKLKTPRDEAALDWLKWTAVVAGAGTGVLVPGLGYFTSYPPPLLPASAFLASAVALGVLLIVLSASHPFVHKLSVTVVSLPLSLSLLIAYLVSLENSTVLNPRANMEVDRYQVGFGKVDWGLTNRGRVMKERNPEGSLQDWMLDDGLFKPGGPRALWKSGTIIAAGIVNAILYFLSFSLWALGWSVLAKRRVDAKPRSR